MCNRHVPEVIADYEAARGDGGTEDEEAVEADPAADECGCDDAPGKRSGVLGTVTDVFAR